MRAGRVVAVVVGCLLVVPGVGLLLAGGGLTLAYTLGRDDAGYVGSGVERLETPTPAVTVEDVDLLAGPGTPGWLLDRLDTDVRVRASAEAGEVFLGIADAADVTAYLDGVAHDRLVDAATGPGSPVYRRDPGGFTAPAPGEQPFWVASTSGTGTVQLDWAATDGRWSAVLMNADGSAGVVADVSAGARSGAVLPVGLSLLAAGVVLTALGVVLIVVGAAGSRPAEPGTGWPVPAQGTGDRGATAAGAGAGAQPVALSGRLDPDLSRWMWLVKWLLAIPHAVVLAFLWVAFVVLTVVAGVAVLVTGRYPRSIFGFTSGVLRWSWRVSFYAGSGGLGTDRYPPFSLGAAPDYPARLEIAYPRQLSRGLVLVKWWLLAIPHYLVLAVLLGWPVAWTTDGDPVQVQAPAGGGLLAVLVIIAAVALLFTGRYPPALFDLVVGLNRWVYRVIAYVALMTDRYPPFRLDQGGSEPGPPSPGPVPGPGDRQQAGDRVSA